MILVRSAGHGVYLLSHVPEELRPEEAPDFSPAMEQVPGAERILLDSLRPGRALLIASEGHPTGRYELSLLTEEDMDSIRAAAGSAGSPASDRLRAVVRTAAGEA